MAINPIFEPFASRPTDQAARKPLIQPLTVSISAYLHILAMVQGDSIS
jgi:hypothetical protein